VNRCLLETQDAELVPQSKWTIANGEQGLRSVGWYVEVAQQAGIDSSLSSLPARNISSKAWPEGIELDPTRGP